MSEEGGRPTLEEYVRERLRESVLKELDLFVDLVASGVNAEGYEDDLRRSAEKGAVEYVASRVWIDFFVDEAGPYVEANIDDDDGHEETLRLRFSPEEVLQLDSHPGIDKPDSCADSRRFRSMTLEAVRAWLAAFSEIETRLLAHTDK